MKKLSLIGLLCIYAFADIKVDFIETKEVKIPEISGNYQGTRTFTIVCINGYKWLQSGYGPSGTLSQMFENTDITSVMPTYTAKAITCKNKD